MTQSDIEKRLKEIQSKKNYNDYVSDEDDIQSYEKNKTGSIFKNNKIDYWLILSKIIL